DNAGNSGGGGGSMSSSTSTLAWNSNAQGYRIYIIDKNFIRISKVYDFLYKSPSDIGSWERNTRFDDASSPTTGNTENIYDTL
ncbi:MAG: hypothetical protein IJY52_03155, partial [Anaerotignum sp.]|nr:hypothetical protein [Anaerotignum sp.]